MSRASSLIEYALLNFCDPSHDRDLCLDLLKRDENSFFYRKDEYSPMLIKSLTDAASSCFDAGDFELYLMYESLLRTQFATNLRLSQDE